VRITKLHLLLFFLLAGAGIYGSYFWRENRAKLKPETVYPPASEISAPPQTVQAPTPSLQVQPPVQTPPKEEAPPQSVTYVVERGDTLWKISKMKEHFGLGHRWYDIWKANEDKIADFDHLVKGQSLEIPLDKPEGYAWPKTDERRKQKILARKTASSTN
jgi:hypothetical protein